MRAKMTESDADKSVPAVSVIIPFHDALATLDRALDSLVAQSFTNWEAILVDDASRDGGAALAAARAEADPRIRLFHLPDNLGAAQARNHGIRAAQGRWIAFLDADDRWHPEKLARQVPLLQAGAPIVFTAYERVSAVGDSLGIVPARARVGYRDALSGNPIGCLTAVWDSARFGKAELPMLPMHEDYAFWLSLLRQGAEATGLPDVLAFYQVSPKSLSGRKLQAARAAWSILRAEPGMTLPLLVTGFAGYAAQALWRRRPSTQGVPAHRPHRR
ncbi:glycosyltransferase family 2 protein [Cereibacter azotoformans]|uniref:glycosyltransferase family 2 protein n=1 Tax=Cereibacter azotoformans TaxID=43057 RepID=UPI0015D57883|nr:glycosyltransferase family 2 protein [Cereibacter azotoformans]